jgi:hypothetical protein
MAISVLLSVQRLPFPAGSAVYEQLSIGTIAGLTKVKNTDAPAATRVIE